MKSLNLKLLGLVGVVVIVGLVFVGAGCGDKDTTNETSTTTTTPTPTPTSTTTPAATVTPEEKTTGADNNVLLYTNADYQFTVEYPTDWVSSTTVNGTDLGVAFDGPEPGVPYGDWTYVVRVYDGSTDDAVSLDLGHGDISLKDRKQVTYGNVSGERVTFERNTAVWENVYVEIPGKDATIVFSAYRDNQSKYHDTLDAMITSLKFL